MPDSKVQEQVDKDISETISNLEEYFEKQAKSESAQKDDVLAKLRQKSCDKFNSALITMQDEISCVNREK